MNKGSSPQRDEDGSLDHEKNKVTEIKKIPKKKQCQGRFET
jgi:hypothetical protein